MQYFLWPTDKILKSNHIGFMLCSHNLAGLLYFRSIKYMFDWPFLYFDMFIFLPVRHPWLNLPKTLYSLCRWWRWWEQSNIDTTEDRIVAFWSESVKDKPWKQGGYILPPAQNLETIKESNLNDSYAIKLRRRFYRPLIQMTAFQRVFSGMRIFFVTFEPQSLFGIEGE